MTNPFEIIIQRLDHIEHLISNQPKPILEPTTDMDKDNDMIKIDQAATYTGYKKNYLYELVHRNEIPVVRRANGRGIRFSKKELTAWMNAGRPSIIKETIKSLNKE